MWESESGYLGVDESHTVFLCSIFFFFPIFVGQEECCTFRCTVDLAEIESVCHSVDVGINGLDAVSAFHLCCDVECDCHGVWHFVEHMYSGVGVYFVAVAIVDELDLLIDHFFCNDDGIDCCSDGFGCFSVAFILPVGVVVSSKHDGAFVGVAMVAKTNEVGGFFVGVADKDEFVGSYFEGKPLFINFVDLSAHVERVLVVVDEHEHSVGSLSEVVEPVKLYLDGCPIFVIDFDRATLARGKEEQAHQAYQTDSTDETFGFYCQRAIIHQSPPFLSGV